MTNLIYTKAKNKFLTGQINWIGDTIKIALVDGAGYTPSPDADEFLNVIASDAIVATSDALTGKAVDNGAADANDLTMHNVSGSQFEYLVLFKDTGSAATSPLLILIDAATNLPYTPTNGSLLIQFDNGTNKVFRI